MPVRRQSPWLGQFVRNAVHARVAADQPPLATHSQRLRSLALGPHDLSTMTAHVNRQGRSRKPREARPSCCTSTVSRDTFCFYKIPSCLGFLLLFCQTRRNLCCFGVMCGIINLTILLSVPTILNSKIQFHEHLLHCCVARFLYAADFPA